MYQPRSTSRLLAGLALAWLAAHSLSTDAAAAVETWTRRTSNFLSNAVTRGVQVIADSHGDLIVIGIAVDDSAGSDILVLKYSGADGSLLWQRRDDGPAHSQDIPAGVAVDRQGDVVVAGTTTDEDGYPDIYVVKYSGSDGTTRWQQRRNGPARTWDEAAAVAVDSRGDVAVTGYSHRATYPDVYVAKFAADSGALIWEDYYDGPDHSWDEGRALGVDGDGNFIVAGLSTDGNGYQEFYVAKHAGTDGRRLWTKRYGNPEGGHDSIYAVAVDAEGNVALAGSGGGRVQGFYTASLAGTDGALRWEREYTGPENQGGVALAVAVDPQGNVVATGPLWTPTRSDGYTVKYAAADGSRIWDRQYEGPGKVEDRTHVVAVDGLGNVVVAGYTDRGTVAPGTDLYAAKYAAANGAVLWEQRHDGAGHAEDQLLAVAVDADGQALVTGFVAGRDSVQDCYTAKYQALDGSPVWTHVYRGGARSADRPHMVTVDPQGDIVMAGISTTGTSLPGDPTAHYAVKYLADGQLRWEQRPHDPAGSGDQARATAVSSSGDVAVAGFSWSTGDHYTAKYAANDGSLLWWKRQPGVIIANAMTIDAQGHVVVAGYSLAEAGFTNASFYTAKHAAADGQILWKRNDHLDGAEVIAVTTDANGNVAVTGPVRGASFTFDFYTAKYAANDGALLWAKRYGAPGDLDDRPSALVADAQGNVIVTGTSGGDYYTAKYAAANGALVWDQRHPAAADSHAGARAVAVTPQGDVVVTGGSLGPGLNFDYDTIRYAAANGSVLWQRRHNGPDNQDDIATAVIVDAAGDVIVSGRSGTAAGQDDCLTVKYAGATGTVRWEKWYGGPARGDDWPFTPGSLAAGPGGTIALAATSDGRSGPGTDFDFVTIRYVESATITRLPGAGGYRVEFPCLPGRPYAVQRAPTLTGPWTTQSVQTAPASGYIAYTDPSPLPETGFYRLSPPQ